MRQTPTLPWWHPRRLLRGLRGFLVEFAKEHKFELFGAASALVYSILRATGVLVKTGFTAVRFTCGHAGAELHPGFHFLLPFLQRAPQVATRARTLDLPSQRVATAEGLVYLVDTAIQFRVVDARRSLVEVNHLDHGLLVLVSLAVQEVIFGAGRRVLVERAALEEQVAARLTAWTEAWGVSIESTGFTSLTPSPKTLRVTQLRQTVLERRRMGSLLFADLCRQTSALALLGPRALPRRRTRSLRAPTRHSSSRRRLAKRLLWEGFTRDEISRAERRLARALGKESESTSELLTGADRRSMRERLLAKPEKKKIVVQLEIGAARSK